MPRYSHYYNPVTHRRTKRRSRKRGFLGDLGADTSVMSKGITASFDAVKAVGITAMIAAGGAVVTDYVFSSLLTKKGEAKDMLGLTVGGWEENVAKAVVAIAGGIVIGKFAKKPQLGAAFAVGGVMLAFYNIFKQKVLAPTSGLGYIEADRANAFRAARTAPLGAIAASNVKKAGVFQPMQAPYQPMTQAYGMY